MQDHASSEAGVSHYNLITSGIKCLLMINKIPHNLKMFSALIDFILESKCR